MFKSVSGGKLPTRVSKYSASVDLYSNENITIGAGETTIVKLGVEIDSDFFLYEIGSINVDAGGVVTSSHNASDKIDMFMKSHYIQLEPRSSLIAKGLIVGTGVIDLDYKDELKLIVHNPISDVYAIPSTDINGNFIDMEIEINDNENRESFTIKKGDRIAQAILCEHKSYLFSIESEDERIGA